MNEKFLLQTERLFLIISHDHKILVVVLGDNTKTCGFKAILKN